MREARANRFTLDWAALRAAEADASSACAPSRPTDLAELARYIDWTPFFASWELMGRYPLILEDDVVGEAARDLFADAQAMLKRIIDEKWFTARGVVGFWPANADGDDIVVYADESARRRARPLPHAAPADGAARTASAANVALSPTSSRRARPASATGSAASR